MLPFPQQVPTIFSPSHSINLNLLPTSGNSASTGAVATFAGSGPSGRKAAECASCCELVGPQYIHRARRAASLVGPTRPTAGLESPVLHKFRGFQVGKKLCGKKKKCKD